MRGGYDLMIDLEVRGLEVGVMRVEGAEDLPLPKYETEQAAGLDLRANVEDTVILKKGEIKLIGTGIKIELPEGYEAQVRPRSGLAAKHGITVLNTPGTVDADYRGEVKVILINLGEKDFEINRGDRIAQLVINRYERVKLVEKEELSKTVRDKGGFGHTKIK